jgi:hypothetical protein
MTPVALGVLLLACILMFTVKRKYMIVPLMLATLMLSSENQLVILGTHLAIGRILIFLAWIRILWNGFINRSDPYPGPLTTIDKIFTFWTVSGATLYALHWMDIGAFMNRLGFVYSTLGMYFLLRYVIRDREDVFRTIKVIGLLLIPVAVTMWIEHSTGRNPLAILGAPQFSEIRNGSVRAQGPFGHSIIAGTFSAMLVPLILALWREGKGNRIVGGLALVACTVITITSASSTPLMTYAAAVGCLCLWTFRRNMRMFRWGLVLFLILVQAFMKVPVWFLINRVSALTGGTGWHRAELIDQFVHHFFEWWLIGTSNNAAWGLDMWDSINAYVRAGVEGGLLTFILFIALFVVAYKKIGIARRLSEGDVKEERLMWALGSTLFANTIAFFGIIYFDQSSIGWYAVLVMISVMTASIIESKQVREEPEFEYLRAKPEKLETAAVSSAVGRLPSYEKRLKYE